MNRDITKLWEDFYDLTDRPFGSEQEFFQFLLSRFSIDEVELEQLVWCANSTISMFYDMEQFKKRRKKEALNNMDSIFMFGFFFGMYISQGES